MARIPSVRGRHAVTDLRGTDGTMRPSGHHDDFGWLRRTLRPANLLAGPRGPRQTDCPSYVRIRSRLRRPDRQPAAARGLAAAPGRPAVAARDDRAEPAEAWARPGGPLRGGSG